MASRKVTDINEIRQAAARAAEGERLKFERKPEPGAPPYTAADVWHAATSEQDGDAWLFVQLFRDKLCFDHAASRWYLFSGYWREARIDEPIAMLDAVIRIYEEEAQRCLWEASKKGKNSGATAQEENSESKKTRKMYLAKIRQLQRMHWKTAVLSRSAAGSGSLGISGDEWDSQPWWIGCPNGVLELRPYRFRDARPEDFVKTVCPTEWKRLDEPAPAWEQFLMDVFGGDADLVAYVQRLIGASLVGQVVEHVIPIFWGKGRNGKGTFFETIASVLGPLATPIRSEMLLEQRNMESSRGPSSDIMALRGRRIVWGSETSEDRKFHVNKVKWLTGGDTLTGREIYGRREVNFAPTHSLFIITNHRPKADPSDYALWQRIHLIPFEYSFIDDPDPENPKERKRDRLLGEKLKTESSGILAWMVRGCLEWIQSELRPPRVVLEATAEYRKDEDIIGHFIDDCCEKDPSSEVMASELYKAYRGWCEANGHKPISGTKFGIKMKLSYKSRLCICVYYQGLRLRN